MLLKSWCLIGLNKRYILLNPRATLVNSSPYTICFNTQLQAIKQVVEDLTTMVRIHHPNVLHYYGLCVISGTEIWIVMEFADGGNLSTFLKTQV